MFDWENLPDVVDTPWERARQFVEHRAAHGVSPIVISAPHGGKLSPPDIPDRTTGSHTNDINSYELADAIWRSFPESKRPALVASHLHRRKLDANRPQREAACGNALAEAAWELYHDAIAQELRGATVKHGIALLLDVHGQSHRPATELGYALTAADLRLVDTEFDARSSTMDALLRRKPGTGTSLAALVRGEKSLGALLENAGFACTPSLRQPQPVTAEALEAAVEKGLPPPRFFPGNYTVRRYGTPKEVSDEDQPLSQAACEEWANQVVAVQVEAELLARQSAQREAFGAAVHAAALEFLAVHGG